MAPTDRVETPFAQMSPSEERRQRAVDDLGLVRSRHVEALDRITRVARSMFGIDMSTVTVLTHDEAWFPGSAGYDGTPLPRRDTFCDRTVADDSLTLVTDAYVDRRFTRLPLVNDGGVRFYAGAPLRDRTGNVLGTLCLFDSKPRILDDEELESFLDLAAWAEHELVSHAEMSHAGRIQAALLPAEPLTVADWDVRGVCLPALAVGGDILDYGVNNATIHLGVGDVMGKGTGAALVGAGVRSSIRATHGPVTHGADLGTTTTKAARGLQDDLDRAESFVTAFACAIDVPSGRTRWVDAGSGLTLVVRADGTAERLISEDRPMGILPGDTWTEHRTVLGAGDRLATFSDGVLDLFDDHLHWWDSLADLVRGASDAADFLDRIRALASAHTAFDDVTALAAFRAPAA